MQPLATSWRSIRWLVAIAMFLLLVACNGGGGGGGSSSNSSSDDGFTVSATSLSFNAAQYGPLPSNQEIQTSFTNPEAVYVGAAYPQGVSPASWLTITSSGSGASYTFNFSINDTNLLPGTYTTTIGLGIARSNGSIIAYKYVDIKYNVMDKVVARLTTNLGEIYVWPSPGTPDVGLLSYERQIFNGVYNGALIHRVIPGYVIQGGEYNASYTSLSPVGVMDINNINTKKNYLGTVGLTKTASNNSPGFFFNLDNNHHLDLTQNAGYEVIGNLDVNSRTQETIKKSLAFRASQIPLMDRMPPLDRQPKLRLWGI